MAGEAGVLLWIDASAGIAGDMLLGALLDAGTSLDAVRSAVSAVVPGEILMQTSTVRRAGLRALNVDVKSTSDEHPRRSWPQIRAMLAEAELPAPVRGPALAAFARLAGAEARVHGVATDEVHFHEVGSWDSIADIVGVFAALAELNVAQVTASPGRWDPDVSDPDRASARSATRAGAQDGAAIPRAGRHARPRRRAGTRDVPAHRCRPPRPAW